MIWQLQNDYCRIIKLEYTMKRFKKLFKRYTNLLASIFMIILLTLTIVLVYTTHDYFLN